MSSAHHPWCTRSLVHTSLVHTFLVHTLPAPAQETGAKGALQLAFCFIPQCVFSAPNLQPMRAASTKKLRVSARHTLAGNAIHPSCTELEIEPPRKRKTRDPGMSKLKGTKKKWL